MVKKRVSKARPKQKKTVKKTVKKIVKKDSSKSEKKVEQAIIQEIKQEETEFFIGDKTWSGWAKRYAPVIIMQAIGLSTYFFLVFYLFYPQALMQGHYIQLLILLAFVFLIAGILLYVGMRTEFMFVRILSFTFVFVIFTLIMVFILLAHAMQVNA